MVATKGTNKGNKHALKCKTSKARKALCRAYCRHVEQGYSDASFPKCSIKTIKSYMDKYPSDFPTDVIEAAQRKRRLFWEQLGVKAVLGEMPSFNSRVWTFNMKNRFGWSDRVGEDESLDEENAITEIRYFVPIPPE